MKNFNYTPMKMKSVSQYAEEMLLYRNSPDALVALKLTLSGNLAFLLDTEYKPVKLQKAIFWQMKENECEYIDDKLKVICKRVKPLSDTMVDALWKITPGGDKEIRLEITTRAYKVLLDAITTSVTWSQSQARLERGM